jgi:hypothetical protein
MQLLEKVNILRGTRTKKSDPAGDPIFESIISTNTKPYAKRL